MKMVVATICLTSLVGCGSTTEYRTQDLVIDKQIPAMSRNEVIMAIQDCESNGLRAVIINGKRKINGFTTDVIVDITCAPKLRY
jgi:uncharacterized protein YcfL